MQKLPGEVRVFCARDARPLAKGVGIGDLDDRRERGGGDIERHDQPIVTIDHAELCHAEAGEIVRLRVEPAEVHLPVFKLPVAIRGHAGKTQRRRHDTQLVFLHRGVFLLEEKLGLAVHVEGIPVDLAPFVQRSMQDALVLPAPGADAKMILKPLRDPGIIGPFTSGRGNISAKPIEPARGRSPCLGIPAAEPGRSARFQLFCCGQAIRCLAGDELKIWRYRLRAIPDG